MDWKHSFHFFSGEKGSYAMKRMLRLEGFERSESLYAKTKQYEEDVVQRGSIYILYLRAEI